MGSVRLAAVWLCLRRIIATTCVALFLGGLLYQQLKEELGLDHFEGRSWPGFHHHATLFFLAHAFLALERALGTPTALHDRAEGPTSPFRA